MGNGVFIIMKDPYHQDLYHESMVEGILLTLVGQELLYFILGYYLHTCPKNFNSFFSVIVAIAIFMFYVIHVIAYVTTAFLKSTNEGRREE